MQFLESLKQNPALIALLWLLLSALLTAVFGPHSPEQLAGYPSWAQKVLHITGALGIDVPKLLQLLKGGAGPGPLVGVLVMAFALSGCAWWTANGKAVEQAGLSLTQLACLEASQFTSAPEVAVACQIDEALVPTLEKLLAQKAAARRAGFSWSGDAGAEAGK